MAGSKVRRIITRLSVAAVAAGTLGAATVLWAADKKKEDLFRQVELFSVALSTIQAEYVEDVSPKDLIYGALKGMVSSLDPHSQFLDPDTYNELKVDTEGKFGGVGIEITVKDGLLTVVTPIEDTPAWNAGVKAGDRIVKINNELTRDVTLTDAVKKLRGTPGEPVVITVLREGEKKLIDIKLVRDVIKIKDIKEARILEDGIAYVRLVEFREGTAADLRKTLERLSQEGMKSLVLDLRNNPGGLLDSAVGVAELFVERGKQIVSIQGKRKDQNQAFAARAKKTYEALAMVVLVNEGSASGSEIVAGCLQDYRRAIVVGTKSFGKGSVQTVIPLGDGSALRLTTSKYFTPSGKVIHNKGVMPDIIAEEGRIQMAEKEEETDPSAETVFETIDAQNAKPKEQAAHDQFDYRSDNQLMRAIDVLKALSFFKGNGVS